MLPFLHPQLLQYGTNKAVNMTLSLHLLKEYKEYTKHQLNGTEDKVIFRCILRHHYSPLFLQTLIILKTIFYDHLCYRARVFLQQKMYVG